ncbi:hypothetical protein NDS46_31080 (plasmid) [Paenibacillus thiaminolyticus]|uniref:hypothetical protein n=1 Tax=Paenibacillus thiaminolyticus TaxID=49283 RepID=UPI00232D4B26|nr:hypothetical protein [Paenibacillus thiaminolyticus]WCF11402.1 hypothetical protein NDS46_31080 [Paenibacillus thiaminolyticus]
MNQWLLKKLMTIRMNQAVMKADHVCEECGNVDRIMRRISTLYLLGYILVGVLIGLFSRWWIGFILLYVLVFIEIKRSQPQCRKCLSYKVHVATEDERREIDSNKGQS